MRYVLLVATLYIIVLAGVGRSEEQQPTLDQLKTQISILTDQITTLRKQLVEKDSEIYKKYQETKIEEYEFQKRLMEINLKTFDEQSIQTFVIMLLVVFVTMSGIAFSAFQLWKAMSIGGVQISSELEMSAKNVRVTSSVVGVTVLVISIVFLYIYIREVYAFKFIDPFEPNVVRPKG